MCVQDGTDCGRDGGGGGGGRFFRFWNRADPFVLIGPLQLTTTGSTERENEEGMRLGVLGEIRSSAILVTHRERVVFFPRTTTTWVFFPFSIPIERIWIWRFPVSPTYTVVVFRRQR